MALEPLGIVRLEAMHYYVHDLARSRRFYTEKLDFAEVATSSQELEREGRQRSAVFEAGGVRVVCSQPTGEGGRAWRWLKKHPDGVGTLVFEVEDIDKTFRAARGARRHADRRHRDVHRRRRHAAPVLDHDAVRRLHVPVSASAAAIARCSRVPRHTTAAARTSSASRRSITSRRTSRR